MAKAKIPARIATLKKDMNPSFSIQKNKKEIKEIFSKQSVAGGKTLLLYYFFTLLFFVIDRILKYCALNQRAVGSNLPSGFFNFAKNTGVAFSIPIPQTILYSIVIAILILLTSISVKYLKQKKYFFHFLTLLLITGAVSNFIDRIKFGFVIDYINLKFWPVFNIADVMIVVGVGLWILFLSKKKRPSNIERPAN